MRQAVSSHRECSGLEMLQRNFPGKLTQAERTMQRVDSGVLWDQYLLGEGTEAEMGRGGS